jgi:Ca2+-binding RTX toxin-like protein
MGKIDYHKADHAFDSHWLEDFLIYHPIQGDSAVGVQKHTSTAFDFEDFRLLSEVKTKGSGFKYTSDNALKSGTIKSATVENYAQKMSFSGLTVDVKKYNAATQYDLVKLVAVNTKALSGNDTIEGSKFNDAILGYKGKDVLNGGKGDDTLDGGKGNDTLDGGKGYDKLFGGAGRDHFKFAKADGDQIEDFVQGVDKIDLVKKGFSALGSSVTADEFVQREDGIAQTKDQHLIYNSGFGVLYYDADGNGAAAPVAIAYFDVETLTFEDFRIV